MIFDVSIENETAEDKTAILALPPAVQIQSSASCTNSH